MGSKGVDGVEHWRRSKRAGVELSGVRERVPISVSATTAGRALSLASVISASVTRRRPASSSSVEADYVPRFLSPNPPLYVRRPVDLEPISSPA